MTGEFGDPNDPRFLAAIDLVRRSGAASLDLRYQDDQEPVVWIVGASWRQRRGGVDGRYFDFQAGMSPLRAILRLLDLVIAGGLCMHCGRPTNVSDDWAREQPLADEVCWYVFDPELATFRRSCEGDTLPRAGRNDPCPCGSGRKYKRCHGGGAGGQPAGPCPAEQEVDDDAAETPDDDGDDPRRT